MIKTLSVALLTASALAAGSAHAADGCGPERFRYGLFGRCHWKGPPPPPPPPPPPGYYGPVPAYGPGPGYYGGPAYYAGPAYGPVVVGRWYPGHGYWDGRRYWGRRRAWYGGWRYY